MTKKPTGLIQNKAIIPKEQPKVSVKKKRGRTAKKRNVHTNQTANVKVSQPTKEKIDILLQLTENKFAYEMIEEMINVYVDTKLTSDQKRAFKALKELIK